jgi:UDP-N-acetylglucosamine--N-acetylmuramyl-(pentapeptide) pyrophosphoryl-undecaprenol N-acetylglucosamine transferase
MRTAPLRVVIAGGGTGGHVYPGLAVAREIQRQRPGAVVTFAGTAAGLEARVVPREGFAVDFIRSAGLKGKRWRDRARGVALLPLGLVDAWRLLSRRRPHLVIGVGGYSSGPVVLVAALRRIPTLVLEQNAVPGATNRWLARVVRAAAVTYEATLAYFRGKGFVSGNPVRPEFVSAAAPGREAAPDDRVRVLILGGSQGAHAINVAMVEAAPELAAAGGRLSVWHQTGARDLAFVREAYARAGLDARVEPFIDAVADAMRWADLVVCRAGATTLAELAAVGRAAILVPLAAAADDHQRRNADVLVEAGAAERLDERDLSGRTLAARVLELAGDPPRRTAMAAAARALARPDAARRIVERALQLVET